MIIIQATASAFESVKPNVKGAAFVLPLTRTVQEVYYYYSNNEEINNNNDNDDDNNNYYYYK